MINKEIINKYPKSIKEFADYFGYPISMVNIMLFDSFAEYFDSKGLFIGITCDADGLFWIAEVCSVPLGVVSSREKAMILGIEECFKLLEENE